MENPSKWLICDSEKEELISALTPELPALRIKAGISQEDLSSLIGISRQTYGAIERGVRRMSWNTFLSLVLFFDYNSKTHRLIRTIGVFPQDVVNKINNTTESNEINLEAFLGASAKEIIKSLDEQALQTIKTMIMLEYARCTATPGEVIVKSFDGKNFAVPTESIRAKQALKAIKESKQSHEQP